MMLHDTIYPSRLGMKQVRDSQLYSFLLKGILLFIPMGFDPMSHIIVISRC